MTARGNVELNQGSRVLLADTVTYNRKANSVTASGKVSLLEPTGEVLFTDYAELNNALKTGFIKNLRALLTDGSRLAAAQAERTADERKVMERAVFSPCNLCKEDPERAPLWQIKAVKVVHDERAKDIIYTNATLEMFGVPVLYTPYLSHPDPTVDRRSGLLAPTLGVSGNLGAIYGQPYHYVFDRSRDVTIEPTVYTAEGSILQGEYRQRFGNGEINLKATGGWVDQHDGSNETGERDLEGSADFEGRFALNRTWRSGFDFEQSSERTYLRRFRLGGEDVLTSRLFAEGFRGRNYTAINAYKWQDLRASTNPDDTPTVLPMAEYHHVGRPDPYGGRSSIDASVLSLTRDAGSDSQRASMVYGWALPHTTAGGEVYTLNARLQTDGYLASDQTSGGTGDNSEATGRVFPQVGLKWQYPLARRGSSYTQVVEPIIGVVAGPRGGNPDEIPNEDSRSFEFDTTNLFRLNRFEGVDQVTSGSRVNYALRTGVYGDGGGQTEVLVGQSFRFYGNGAFDKGSGLDDDLSDIVGAITVRPRDALDFRYRFRLDPASGSLNRNEVGFGYNYGRFAFLADYVQLDESVSSDLAGDREQIELTLHTRLTDNWNLLTNAIHDLSDGENRLLRGKIGLTYTDECLLFGVDFERSDISDEDIEPDDRVMFRIVFKHLGGVESK
ncbi:MAG: LPS-assembly protein LptD [Alphaproteobacteria bacterium]|nr:LPS-assembly protein LptD [Alphaproteobacteria bacterium]